MIHRSDLGPSYCEAFEKLLHSAMRRRGYSEVEIDGYDGTIKQMIDHDFSAEQIVDFVTSAIVERRERDGKN